MRFYQLFATTALISGAYLSPSEAAGESQKQAPASPSSDVSQTTSSHTDKGEKVNAPTKPSYRR